MKFLEALKKLDIQQYADRIYNSNSRGELFHLMDYFFMAEHIKDGMAPTFKEWFDNIVKEAEETWDRPESVFQHIPRILAEQGLIKW